ncbi:MAG: haloalkane dehalogenase [Bacteroidota bacterium]
MNAGVLLSLLLAAAPAELPKAAWRGYEYLQHEVDVAGHPMRYVESGAGDPILLLHGIPTHGYLWRNVVDGLDRHGRVIVPDLMGYGASYQGDELSYDGQSQQRYFDAFMDALDLQDVTLVVNDLGSVLGLHWASRHPDRVKRIILVEAAMLDGPSWYRHLPLKMKMMFSLMRNPRRAEKYLVDKNMMVETMIPKLGVKRRLTEDEMHAYREPFATEDVRARVLTPLGPAAMPKKGRSQDAWDAAGMMDTYADWLRTTNIPKLLLWARPGLIASPSAVRQAKRTFTNLKSVKLPGRGVHFLAEDHPDAIAAEVARFIDETP